MAAAGMLAAAVMEASAMAAAGMAIARTVAAGMAAARMEPAAMAAAAKVAEGLGYEGTRLPSKRLAFSTYWVVGACDMCRILTFLDCGKAVGLWDSYRSPPPRIWGLAAASRCILERSYVTAILTVIEARYEKRAIECT